MGNCYLDYMFPKGETLGEDLLKRRDNPILQYVQQREMSDYVVFDRTKAMEIFLHSKQYKLLDFNFETEDPYWASKDFKFEKYFIDKWKEMKLKEKLCQKCKVELVIKPLEFAEVEKVEKPENELLSKTDNLQAEKQEDGQVLLPETVQTQTESHLTDQPKEHQNSS